MDNDAHFRELVQRDVKGIVTKEEAEFLHANLPAWRAVLVGMEQDLQVQFSNRKADSFEDPSIRPEYEDWKATANGFKRALGNKLRDVNRLMKASGLLAHPENQREKMITLLEKILERLDELNNTMKQLSVETV